MNKKDILTTLASCLLMLLLGYGIYRLTVRLIDCSRGNTLTVSAQVVDKEYRDAWTEVYSDQESYVVNGVTRHRTVLKSRHHDAQYRLWIYDADGRRSKLVSSGLYNLYPVGSAVPVRKRYGKTCGCKCWESVALAN